VMASVGQAPDYAYPLTLEVIDFLEYSDWGPVWSPDGTQIAFHSNRNGNLDIFILDPETYEVTQVTTSEEADGYAAWSPDGTRLVYQCTINEGREICIIDVTGENLVQLTENDRFDGLPDWSPDGTRIVFASTRDEEKEELYIMQGDGSEVRRLTERPNSIDTDPKWSPDGEFILFESDEGGDFEVCLIRVDGTGLECLTDNELEDRSPDW
jgi:Tol biopolymer transport system component